MPPSAVFQLIDPKLMIEPPPRRFICGATDWMAKNIGRRLIAMRSSQYSGVTLLQSWRMSLAALLTSTPTSPRSRPTRSIVAWKAGISVMSQRVKCGATPYCARMVSHNARLDASSMSTKATRAPWSTKPSTMAASMPEPPPVTNTVLPRKLGYLPKSVRFMNAIYFGTMSRRGSSRPHAADAGKHPSGRSLSALAFRLRHVAGLARFVNHAAGVGQQSPRGLARGARTAAADRDQDGLVQRQGLAHILVMRGGELEHVAERRFDHETERHQQFIAGRAQD